MQVLMISCIVNHQKHTHPSFLLTFSMPTNWTNLALRACWSIFSTGAESGGGVWYFSLTAVSRSTPVVILPALTNEPEDSNLKKKIN